MTTQLSQRDIETLSTYLDGQLSSTELAHLESRLKVESELRTTLEEMSRTRTVLRSAPIMKAPRNYTLKPGMVVLRQRTPRAYPILRLASALASILFVLSFFSDVFGFGIPAQAPVAMVQQEAPRETLVIEEAEATGQALMQSKAPPASGAEPAQESLFTQAATETVTAPMLQMEMLAASPEATQPGLEPGSEAGDALRQAPETQPEQPMVQTDLEDQPESMTTIPNGWWNSLRVFEIVALICALATGLAAIYVRRKGSGS